MEGCLRSGELIPVFYEPLAYEWIEDNSIERALEIASVFDTALCVRSVLPDPVLFLIEAMNAAKASEPRLDFRGFPILTDLGSGREVAAWFRSVWQDQAEHPTAVAVVVHRDATGPSVSGLVRALKPTLDRGIGLRKEALDGERAALKQTRSTQEAFRRKGPCPEGFKRHWLKTAHRLDQVLRLTSPALDPEEILARIDLSLCPATTFKVDAYWQYARANDSPRENDTADLMQLAPMPYVDLVLTERRLAAFVRQSGHLEVSRRVFSDPTQLLEALRKPCPREPKAES